MSSEGYRGPTFPAREMYTSVPGPMLREMRAVFNGLLLRNFGDEEIQQGRLLLTENDPEFNTPE